MVANCVDEFARCVNNGSVYIVRVLDDTTTVADDYIVAM